MTESFYTSQDRFGMLVVTGAGGTASTGRIS